MSISRDLIRSIADEDFVSAKELTHELLFSTASDYIDGVRAEVAQEVFEDCEECDDELDEQLIGKQKKLDKNKNNRLDAEDFKILRGEK
jgi:DNA polymerase III delta prime subunit